MTAKSDEGEVVNSGGDPVMARYPGSRIGNTASPERIKSIKPVSIATKVKNLLRSC